MASPQNKGIWADKIEVAWYDRWKTMPRRPAVEKNPALPWRTQQWKQVECEWCGVWEKHSVKEQ